MEKPVRIIPNEKIRTFNEKVRNGLEHALNFMMGQEGKIQIAPLEPFLMPIETYIQAYRKKSILIKIHAENSFKNELYWFFELKTAIVLGAMMRMMPVNALEEKLVKGDFDATDQDSFGEVGNQLSGILDRAFRLLTNKNIHLRMDFNKKVYPDEAIRLENFVNTEEYVVLLTSITLPGYGAQKLTLLLPRSLYEVLLNIEISLEGITPKCIVVHAPTPELLERIQAEMNSRYTKIIPAASPDDVFNLLDSGTVAAVGIGLKSMKFPLQHQDAIFFKRLVSNRTFMRLPYFLTWENVDAASLVEVRRLGLTGASNGSIDKEFPRWALAVTGDTSKKQAA
jgi:hypothetical protein